MVPVVISNFSLKMFSKQHRSSKSVIDTKSSPCTITTISRPSCPNVRVTPRGTRNPQWHDKSVWHVCQCLAADLVPYIDTEGSPDMPSSSGPLSSSQSATLTTCGAAHGVCLVLLVCVNAPDLDRHLLRHLLALLDWYLLENLHLLCHFSAFRASRTRPGSSLQLFTSSQASSFWFSGSWHLSARSLTFSVYSSRWQPRNSLKSSSKYSQRRSFPSTTGMYLRSTLTMSSACFPTADEYVEPDAVVQSIGYDSN